MSIRHAYQGLRQNGDFSHASKGAKILDFGHASQRSEDLNFGCAS